MSNNQNGQEDFRIRNDAEVEGRGAGVHGGRMGGAVVAILGDGGGDRLSAKLTRFPQEGGRVGGWQSKC